MKIRVRYELMTINLSSSLFNTLIAAKSGGAPHGPSGVTYEGEGVGALAL